MNKTLTSNEKLTIVKLGKALSASFQFLPFWRVPPEIESSYETYKASKFNPSLNYKENNELGFGLGHLGWAGRLTQHSVKTKTNKKQKQNVKGQILGARD